METEREMEQRADDRAGEEQTSAEQTGEQAGNEPRAESATMAAADEVTEPLFPEEDLVGHRARWQEIQAGFVDEPQRAVEQADELVADLLEQVNVRFAEARSRLEDQWSRGEEASTEDLRVALTRYRSFFNRLLAA